MSLFRFRQQIELSYIKGAPIRETKGRPRVSIIDDIGFDNTVQPAYMERFGAAPISRKNI